MAYTIADGVWPTMVTPFTPRREIDYPALDALVEWYIQKGVAGLFAVCLSSEMFRLSLRERIELTEAVVRRAAGRVPVIASGHVSESASDQAEEIRRVGDTGVDAVVLVTNRLAGPEDDDAAFRDAVSALLDSLPDSLALGLYECPVPYKRILSPELLAFCAETRRFHFLKDTCCDLQLIDAKLRAVKGSALRIFNANAATLYRSLQLGVAGYSGVMANFHPELYVWLCRHRQEHAEHAQSVQDFLGLASLVERQLYPTNAKYHLQLEGLPIGLTCRTQSASSLTPAMRLVVEQLRGVGLSVQGALP
jgi:4-hydroxy-tetrahydrodipicolinate synthase